MWRRGTPSFSLDYELSFWSDLAKRLFWMVEKGEAYTCSMIGGEDKELPSWLEFSFEEVTIGFYLSMANLPRLLPSLAQIKTPIPIHHVGEESLTQIIYDQEEGVMRV